MVNSEAASAGQRTAARIEGFMNSLNIADRSGSRKYATQRGIGSFPASRTVKLGNVDSRNLSVGVVLAMLDRYGIEHCEGVASLRRSEARNLRRVLFGSRGTRIVPRDKGQMAFELFDGMLYLDYERRHPGCSEASHVLLNVVEWRVVQ